MLPPFSRATLLAVGGVSQNFCRPLFASEALERVKRGSDNRWEHWWEGGAPNQSESWDAQHQELSAGFSSWPPEEVGSFMLLGWQWAGAHCSAEGQ